MKGLLDSLTKKLVGSLLLLSATATYADADIQRTASTINKPDNVKMPRLLSILVHHTV